MPFPGEDRTYYVPCEHALNPPCDFEDTCHYCMQQVVRNADKERGRHEEIAFYNEVDKMYRTEAWKRILLKKEWMDGCLREVRQMAYESHATETQEEDRIQTVKAQMRYEQTPNADYIAWLDGAIPQAEPR